MVHTSYASTQEAEAGGLQVQSHSGLHGMFQASLDHLMRLSYCLEVFQLRPKVDQQTQESTLPYTP